MQDAQTIIRHTRDFKVWTNTTKDMSLHANGKIVERTIGLDPFTRKLVSSEMVTSHDPAVARRYFDRVEKKLEEVEAAAIAGGIFYNK